MRILILGPTVRFGRGGIETQIQQLEAALEQLGHRCEALDTFHQPWTGRLAIQLARALGRCNVVLMMGLHLKALALCVLIRRPVLLSRHIQEGGTGWKGKLHRWVAQRLPVIYNSSFLASREHTGRLPARVVHPCFAAGAYPPLFQLNQGWEQRPYAVGFVGRLIPEKGAEQLLQTCVALKRPEISVLIIGDGPCREGLQALAVEHGLQVHFSGGVDAPAVAQLLQQIRVLVIPSRWQEPFGVVMLEGLAAGCQVLASSIGGLPEAGAQHAHYVPAGDQPALTAALNALLDGAPPQHLEARQRHLQRFAPLAVAREIEAELQQLLR